MLGCFENGVRRCRFLDLVKSGPGCCHISKKCYLVLYWLWSDFFFGKQMFHSLQRCSRDEQMTRAVTGKKNHENVSRENRESQVRSVHPRFDVPRVSNETSDDSRFRKSPRSGPSQNEASREGDRRTARRLLLRSDLSPLRGVSDLQMRPHALYSINKPRGFADSRT